MLILLCCFVVFLYVVCFVRYHSYCIVCLLFGVSLCVCVYVWRCVFRRVFFVFLWFWCVIVMFVVCLFMSRLFVCVRCVVLFNVRVMSVLFSRS